MTFLAGIFIGCLWGFLLGVFMSAASRSDRCEEMEAMLRRCEGSER